MNTFHGVCSIVTCANLANLQHATVYSPNCPKMAEAIQREGIRALQDQVSGSNYQTRETEQIYRLSMRMGVAT